LAARKEVERRMAAQLPEAEKIKIADYVIDNSGSLEQTREQMRQVWQRLQRGVSAENRDLRNDLENDAAAAIVTTL
jgi:dephospho-CoA kinase